MYTLRTVQRAVAAAAPPGFDSMGIKRPRAFQPIHKHTRQEMPINLGFEWRNGNTKEGYLYSQGDTESVPTA